MARARKVLRAAAQAASAGMATFSLQAVNAGMATSS